MRVVANVLAALLIIAGGIWFLQGISVIPGSFMTGQMTWAIMGGICVVAGVSLLLSANRRTKP